VITGVSAGNATITATTRDGSKTATCYVTVGNVAVSGINMNKTTAAVFVGFTEQLRATLVPSNAFSQTFTWTSDKETVATVDRSGLVTAVAPGNATITATSIGKTATCAVTVTYANPVTAISLDQSTLNLTAIGTNTGLAATIVPSNATYSVISWMSSDNSIATVSANGVVSAVGFGSATVTATTLDGNKAATCVIYVVNVDLSALTVTAGTLSPPFNAATTSYTVIVENTITSLSVAATKASSSASLSINPGQPMTLSVGDNAIEVTVIGANGATKIYRVTATRAASSNAKLSSLVFEPGVLSPAFDPAILNYTASVQYSVSTINVSATVSDTTAALVASPTPPVNLTMGTNTVTMTVTAQNGFQNAYTIIVTRMDPPAAAPTFNPAEGAFSTAQEITLSTTTDGATIYYTTNGDIPTTSSIEYSGLPISVTIDPSTTIKAIAVAPSYSQSSISTGIYRKQYSLGDNGPAGGIIFYDKGSYTNGWQYLEAAPSDQSGGAQWCGSYATTGARATGLGDGISNTAIIVSKQSGSYAANICSSLVLGGFSDWFLPSYEELEKMYVNLKAKGLGSFALAGYFSSSETTSGNAWGKYFDDNTWGALDKRGSFAVRAARAF